jgi:hypothetical protein
MRENSGMTEPFTLAAVGTLALTEGVKFLYSQAGELLKRWRDRDKNLENAVDVKLPSTAFTGDLGTVMPDMQALSTLVGPLRELRTALAEYAQGVDPLDPTDAGVLGQVNALRRAIEAVYRQRLTFVGEAAEPSGIPVQGSVSAQEVLGYVAGLRAHRITGTASGTVDVDRVGPGGTAVGLDAGEIG